MSGSAECAADTFMPMNVNSVQHVYRMFSMQRTL